MGGDFCLSFYIRANMITSMQEAKYCLAGRFKLQGDILCYVQQTMGIWLAEVIVLNNLELAAELICKGTNGTKIWSIKSKTKYQCPAGVGVRGATTVLTWIHHEDVLT